jgi:hypothetical protein
MYPISGHFVCTKACTFCGACGNRVRIHRFDRTGEGFSTETAKAFDDKPRSFSPRSRENAKAESTRRKIHRGRIFLQAFSAFAPLRFLKELYFFICFAMITGAILL